MEQGKKFDPNPFSVSTSPYQKHSILFWNHTENKIKIQSKPVGNIFIFW